MLRALAFAILAVASADTAAAQGRRLTISLFDADYTVREDGVLEVEERITARFEGSWNGLYRWIPVQYEFEDGGSHRIGLDVSSVEDANGDPLRHEIERKGAVVRIKTWVPGAEDAERTIVYRYSVTNGLRYFDGDPGMQAGHDELYWNVTGNEWEIPILRAQARVRLPAEATGLRATGYTGRYGSRGGDYEQTIAGREVLFETTRRLDPREGFTVVVGWDPGVVARPSTAQRVRWAILDYLFAPVPLIAFGVMFSLWRKKGRDPEIGRSVMPRYEPPDGMRPAEVGTLMDFSVDPRDLSATIIDLAVRGYLRIEEVPSRFRKRPKDHILHVLRDPADAGELADFEEETLRALWELAEDESGEVQGRAVRVSDLKRRFYRYVPRIKRYVYGHLTAKPKLFTARPERVQGAWMGIGVAVGAAAVGLGILATKAHIGLPVVRWASLISAPLIVMGFGLVMPARTLKGVWTLNHVLGLREYIDRVDRHRLKQATLEHFERLLPFAAAMGLEERWTEAFESILTEPPSWYTSHHSGAFHAHYFSRSLGHMASSAGSALVTAPRSASSGSGFSGGGGSGGGFGGGGGGGF